MTQNLVVTLIDPIGSTLDDRGLNQLLLTLKPRYLVSVRPNNYLYAFTFNPTSARLYNTFYKASRWSLNPF